MLQTIRENTQGWISGVIIGAIIISFSLWGIHNYFNASPHANEAVEVNGVNISKQQLSAAYDRLRRQLISQHSIQSVRDEAALKLAALQSLVEFEVLKQAAERAGFRIFDAQVERYLENMPAFQEKGQFSFELFQRVLAGNSLTTSAFFDIVRANLLVDQPHAGILLSSFALPDETETVAALVNQQRDLGYMLIPSHYVQSKPISVTADEIRIYYNQHRQSFLVPEKLRVEYIELSMKTLAEKHMQDKFSDLREQLANITYEHPDTLKNASSALGLPILTTDFFTNSAPGKDIAQYPLVRNAAFSADVLKGQNNSDVIQVTPDTVIVLRVKEYRAATALPLEVVSKQIEDQIRAQKADQQSEMLARQLQQQLDQGADPVGVAKKYQLTWNAVGMIGRYSNKVDTPILDLAFRLPNPELSHLKMSFGYVQTAKGVAVVGVKTVQPGHLDPKDKAVFDEEVQNSLGTLEYELYKRSQLAHAKIKNYL